MDSESKPHRKELKSPGIEQVSSLAELSEAGFTAFVMGPIYTYANVQEDLCECFAGEVPNLDVRGTTMHFDRPVLARCKEWNHILNIMDTSSYLFFLDWLLKMQFADSVRKKFYLVRHFVAPVADPILLDQLNKVVPASLDVFSVSGLGGLLRPRSGLFGATSDPRLAGRMQEDLQVRSSEAKSTVSKVPVFIDFDLAPLEEEVKVLARAALNIMGS